jgi:hypothetical protein
MPELLEAVPARLRRQRTVASALPGSAWIRGIGGALSMPVLSQYLLLRQRLQGWEPFSGRGPASMALVGVWPILRVPSNARWPDVLRVPSKCKFFLWLLLLNRCWTAERRRRHGLQDSATCALCDRDACGVIWLLGVCFPKKSGFRCSVPSAGRWWRRQIILVWHHGGSNSGSGLRARGGLGGSSSGLVGLVRAQRACVP